MDLAPYVPLALLILALIVGGVLLRRWSLRRSASAGDRTGRGLTDPRLAPTLAELGASLVLEAPEPTVREILAEAIDTPRQEFHAREDGGYGIRFADPDDTVVRLTADPGGTRVAVETFREYMGFPQTAPLWTDLRARIGASAAARGITVGQADATVFTRGPLLDDRNARWTSAAGST